MNDLIALGKKRTILISISILLVSLHTIYFYHASVPDVGRGKIIQQLIRFILTVILLLLVYQGKKWARIVAVVLFSFAALGGVASLFTIQADLINKIPVLVMIFVYSIAIYHFAFSASFKAFFNYQNSSKI